MDFPHECLTRGGTTATVFSDKGDAPYILVGGYFSGEGLVPCAWLGNGRLKDDKFTGLDLLLHQE